MALYDNLRLEEGDQLHDNRAHYGNNDSVGELEIKAIALDNAIRSVKKAGWRGNRLKEREVRIAIKSVLGDDDDLVDEIFEIVKNQRDY